MIEKMKSLPKQLETIQENQSKFSENHQTMLTTAKNINQMNKDINKMNQDTIDANQQMKTALDFLSIAYKEIIDKNEKLDDEIQNLEKVPETTKNQVKETKRRRKHWGWGLENQGCQGEGKTRLCLSIVILGKCGNAGV